MIKIQTQAEFDAMKTGLSDGTTTYQKQVIYIYPLDGGYQITSPLLINKSNVRIVGLDNPLIKMVGTPATTDEGGSVIVVKGTAGTPLEKVFIKGLHIQNVGKTSSYGSNGIYCTYVGQAPTAGLTTGTYSRYDSTTVGNTIVNKIGVVIEDCIVEECLAYGTSFYDNCYNSKISECVLQNNGYAGIRSMQSSSNNMIIGNTAQYNGTGIYIGGGSLCSNTLISNNVSQNNNGYGIVVSSMNTGVISNNSCLNNASYGIYISSSNSFSVMDNIVSNNNNYGIFITTASNNTVFSNCIQNSSSHGIYVFSSCSGNSICNNNIWNNSGSGIYLNSTANNTSIVGNYLVNNSGYGIYSQLSARNILYSNVVKSNSTRGVFVSDNSTYHNLYSNVSQNNTTDNLYLGGGSGNINNYNYITNP